MAEPAEARGRRMYELVAELFPVCRSVTGEGLRTTLRRIQQEVPLALEEVPSGTQAFDWTVPPEWNIRDAYVAQDGRRVIDFQASNLHVVSYSSPVRRSMSLAELRPHLFSLPEHPDWIPYRTSYWQEGWGFCLSHRQLLALPEGQYDVCIDSTLAPGSLTYGEYFLPGESADEVLLSCHVCHPSLANDNLSGVALAVELARNLGPTRRRLSYRFLFIPGTIGSLVWLARNPAIPARIKHGLVLGSLGDPGPTTYKRSRRGDAAIDRAAARVFRSAGLADRVRPFTPYGHDERQYCSPGFDLPVGCLSRTPSGEYPEYHSSADNLDLVSPDSLVDSYEVLNRILDALEHDPPYLRADPRGEPQLGRRNLYRGLAGNRQLSATDLTLLWVLNLSDGAHGVADMAERSGQPIEQIRDAVERLRSAGLIHDA